MRTKDREPVQRDLGCIDQHEEKQISGLLDPAGDTQASKLLGHIHRLARRDTASSATLTRRLFVFFISKARRDLSLAFHEANAANRIGDKPSVRLVCVLRDF